MSRFLKAGLFFVFFISACSYPVRQVTNADSAPSILVIGARSGDQLIVDAKVVGDASDYDGDPKVLRVPSGTHRVQIVDSKGKMIHDEKVFIESDVRTIRVGEMK